MNPKKQAFQQLRTVLVTLYSTVEDIQRVVYDSDLPLTHIDLTGKPVNIWTNVLNEAEKRNLVPNLVVATAEYQDNPKLSTAFNEYLQPAPQTTSPVLTVKGQIDEAIIVKVNLRMPQIFTGIIHLLDQENYPLVSWSVENQGNEKRRVMLISYIEGFTAQAISTVTLLGGESCKVAQLPIFFPESLKWIDRPVKAALNLRLENLPSTLEFHNVEPVWLYPVNSFPFSGIDPETGGLSDLSHFLGAYVTPYEPTVYGFLRKVAERHPEKSLVGYQGIVASQVQAIFDALIQDAEIVVVNSFIDFDHQFLTPQRIRLPRQSLLEKQANSIDSILLFASLLEGIAINPAIVIVPGHAFLGWQTSRDKEEWQYLETTLIGTHSFTQALDSGNRKAAVYRKQFETTQNPQWFRRWSIRELREKYRIRPIE